MERVLKKHLSPELNTLNKEINSFQPKLPILNRKWTPKLKTKLSVWFDDFLKNYHQLVLEFDPRKLKIKDQAVLDHKKRNPTLHLLLSEFLEKFPNDLKSICSSCLGESSFLELKKNCQKGPTQLGEWINFYSNKIYRPPRGFIYVLESYTRSSNNSQLRVLGKKIVSQLDLYNEFMSFQIQRDLERGFKYLYSYSDSELDFQVESNSRIDLESYYWKFLYARMKVIARMHSKHKKIGFEIVLSNQKKKLPSKKFFGPREVNSGSTDYETIRIWRSEEHYKLLIHEAIHFYNLDGSYDLFDENKGINLECTYQIGDQNETRIYEAYTESLTIFFHTFANAYQIYYLSNLEKDKKIPRTLNKKNLSEIKDLWDDLWTKEKKFAILQVAKIYHHINPSSKTFADFLIKSEKTCQKERDDVKYKLEQRTSVLSYHFLKTTNLVFDQEFLGSISDLSNPHPKSLTKLMNYFKKLTHNSSFVQVVDSALKYIENNEKKMSKSMRMTFYDVI